MYEVIKLVKIMNFKSGVEYRLKLTSRFILIEVSYTLRIITMDFKPRDELQQFCDYTMIII